MKMKRLPVLLAFVVSVLLLSGCYSMFLNSSGTFVCEISHYCSDNPEYKDFVSFDAYTGSYDSGDFVKYFKMYNNTKERVFIEWENARCEGGKVVFGDDRRISMNNPKADEAVSANSYSLSRDITSMSKIGSDFILPLYHTSRIKKGEDETVMLKIPVRFSDGKVIEYQVFIKYHWQTNDAQ